MPTPKNPTQETRAQRRERQQREALERQQRYDRYVDDTILNSTPDVAWKFSQGLSPSQLSRTSHLLRHKLEGSAHV